MKQLFLIITMFLGIPLFSLQENTLFRDEDTGFVVELPGIMKRTWNVTNCENGIEINVFHTDLETEPLMLVVTGKFPIGFYAGEDAEDAFSQVFEHVKYEIMESYGLDFHIEPLPSLADEKYQGRRFRLVFGEDRENTSLDFHIFLCNSYGYIVLTATLPLENFDTLESFTEQIMKRVRFIEESHEM